MGQGAKKATIFFCPIIMPNIGDTLALGGRIRSVIGAIICTILGLILIIAGLTSLNTDPVHGWGMIFGGLLIGSISVGIAVLTFKSKTFAEVEGVFGVMDMVNQKRPFMPYL
jgi:hypothetical protein